MSGGVFKDTPSLSELLRLMSPKGRNGNHLNQIKMTKEQNPKTPLSVWQYNLNN